MKKWGVVAFALVALAAGRSASSAVLTFDDIPGDGVRAIPAGYGGVNWNDPRFGVWDYQLAQWPPASGSDRVLFNYTSGPGSEFKVTFAAGDVQFMGAWFGTAGTNVHFNLYNNGILVATSATLNTPLYSAAFLNSGYGGAVDEVGIVGTSGLLAMDDFTYEAVPEPATIALLGAGLAGLGLRRRRSA